MEKIKKILFPLSLINLFICGVILFCVGFSLGTVVLIYPVHWITDYTLANNFSNSTENILIKITILLYLILSVILSVWLTRKFLGMKQIGKKVLFFGSLIFSAMFFLWLWFNPDLMGKTSQQKIASENTKNAQFFFGSYPTESTIYDLKEDGFTLIVSLLHPAVVPFETKLINDEEKAVAKIGINYIHIPMLPWISDNVDAINKIKGMIKTEKGKVFIHCYLGKDRVNVVKNIIKNSNGLIENSSENKESRKLDEINKLERGSIIKLDPEVYLIPYPTEEEYFGFILTSPIKQVVSLLNPKNTEDLALIDAEKKLLPQYQITYHLCPLVTEPYDPDSVLRIVEEIKKIKPPVVVHGFFTDGALRESIELTYKTQKQSLPPSLFSPVMKNGPVIVISSNTITGNVPVTSEFRSYLYFRGVRNIGFTGDINSTSYKLLKKEATKSGMKWADFKLADKTMIKALKTDGTWYIFGSPVSEIKEALTERLQIQ